MFYLPHRAPQGGSGRHRVQLGATGYLRAPRVSFRGRATPIVSTQRVLPSLKFLVVHLVRLLQLLGFLYDGAARAADVGAGIQTACFAARVDVETLPKLLLFHTSRQRRIKAVRQAVGGPRR